MIKVKDGYAKLIGTTYLGSSNHLLQSNGGAWEVHTGRNNEVNKIVRTDSNGFLQTGWINTTSGDIGTNTINKIYCSNDNFIRYKTPANFFSSLTNSGDNISITVASQNRTLTVQYANIAGQLRSKGTIAPQTDRTQNLGDVYSYHLNSSVSGGPTTYAAVIGFGRGAQGTVEIAGEWTRGRGLWVRALRDTTDNWYTWDKILTQDTYTGITDSRYYTKTQSDERFVNITGDTMTGELISTNANAYRLRGANYGVILRNDNSSFWILTTDNGSPSGSFNSLRPFRINLSDGRVTLGNGLSVTGTIIGSSTIQGTQLISTIASGTSPLKVTSTTLVNNLNADLLDGWNGVGTSGNVIRKSGYLTSGTSGLSSYWGKVGSFTWLSQYNDRDITLYMHSAFNSLRAIVQIRARWNSTSNVAVSVSILAGNIPTNRIRLYYDSSSVSNTLELWYNISGQYGCINTYVLSDTSRVGQEIGHITLYNTRFSSVQTPSLSSYVEANYVSLLNNSLTATKLQTARTINGTSFDGSSNITTATWGTARNITIGKTTKSVNGSGNYSWSLSEIGVDGAYLPLIGGTMSGTINSTLVTSTYLKGNQGSTLINSTASAGSYVMLFRGNSTNGYFTHGVFQNKYLLQYTSKTTVDAGTNSVSKSVTLLDENGNTVFPGVLQANRFISVVATGTAPLTVNSTTLVTNLNADMLDGYHANGLFTNLSNSGNNLSVTIGGVNKILTVQYSSTTSWLDTNNTLKYGSSGLNYFNLNGTAGTAANSNVTPTSNWYHILRMNHSNSSGYFVDIAIPLNDLGGVWWRQIRSGTNYGWFKILDTNNFTSTLDSRYATLATNQTISGTKTFSTQQKFTVATGTSPFTVASTTKVTNLNSDMVDGYHISTSGTTKPWSTIVTIGSDGVSEMGRYIDFHYNNTTGSDYSTRFQTTGNYSNVVNLPSASGTLALTSQIPTSLKNPYALTIQANGTTLATYDGSSTKTANITVQNAGSGLVHNSLALTLDNTSTDSGWSMINSSYSGFILKAIRTQANAPSWIENNYAAGICFGGADTKGVLSMAYGSPAIKFAGGNGSKPVWWLKITGTSGTTYNLSNMWTGTRYWANIEVSTSSSTETSPTFGNATIKNTTSLKGNVKITNGPRYTYIHFYPNFITSPSGTIYYDAGSNTACTASRFFLRQYSYSSDGSRLAYYEDYKLPNTQIDRTTNGYYDILTNKNTSISGGGSTYGSSITVTINGVSKTLTIPNAPSIPTVTDYYWANVKVSASSNTATTPTFSQVKISYSSYPGLQIIRSGSSNGAIISFANSNGTLGGIGMTGAANGSLKRYTADYQTSYTICDSNNTSFTQSLTSGTTIGTLKIAGTSYTLYCQTNVDTKVTNTLNNSTKFYITGTSSSSTNTGTQYFDNGVYVTTTSGQISSNTIISRSSAYVGNHLYLRNAESGTYADLRVNVVGTTSKGGQTYLLLGNNITTGNDNNAHGVLRLYGSSSGYTDIRCGTNDTSGYTLYLPGASGQIVYHTNDTAIGSSSKPIYISQNGQATASSSTIGSSTKGIYMNSGTLTSMTYSLNATINSGTSNKLAYYSGANAISQYSSTVGNSAVPVYISNGVPTALSDYSFRGTFNQPVILASGYVYRSSVQYNTWYWNGYMQSDLSFNTYSVNEGVFHILFSSSKSISSYTIAIAQINQNFWGDSTTGQGTTSGTYNGRGTGNPNLTCSCSISSSGINVNIRAYRVTDKNNDSWTSNSDLWKQENDSIKSVNIIVIGYISD